LSPGDEIVTAVFAHFGTDYSKPNDTERLARWMHPEEIAPEVVMFISRVITLSGASNDVEPRKNETGSFQ